MEFKHKTGLDKMDEVVHEMKHKMEKKVNKWL